MGRPKDPAGYSGWTGKDSAGGSGSRNPSTGTLPETRQSRRQRGRSTPSRDGGVAVRAASPRVWLPLVPAPVQCPASGTCEQFALEGIPARYRVAVPYHVAARAADRFETEAVERSRAQAIERREMIGRPVALMACETVVRENGVPLRHRLIPLHLRENGGGGD